MTEYSNLPALGRFSPGGVSWADNSGELDVKLETNLAGEPIRFTMNESLDNIVSSATLTLLNATIGDEGEQILGVTGEAVTEEDEAKWGTLYDRAPVEPNQLVTVTESGGGLGECTTYWRVVGVTSYLDEEDVPYYEVQLEGMGQIAVNEKFDPSKIVKETTMAWFYTREYYDSYRNKAQVDADNDGYVTAEETETTSPTVINTIANGTRYIVESPDEYLKPFLAQLTAAGLSCGCGAIPGITTVPIESNISKGESCWQIIEDILGFNGYIARFTRDKRLITIDLANPDSSWSFMPEAKSDSGSPIYAPEDIANPPLVETDIGNFGSGIQLSYSKEGVYSRAMVTGYVGKIDEDGLWQVDGEEPKKQSVEYPAGLNILNGEIVELAVQVDERYQLSSMDQLISFGQKELYKSVISARSATYDSETVPLVVEVGMTICGDSKLSGSTKMFITALNRTTDAQQNTIQTGLSGTRVFDASKTEDSGGGNNSMGWH